MGGEGSMEAMVRNLIFCSSCDYAIDKLERDSLRCRPDAVTCPRCHAVNLTQFYSCGSQTHRDRRESWERGEINGAPLPLEIKMEGKEEEPGDVLAV